MSLNRVMVFYWATVGWVVRYLKTALSPTPLNETTDITTSHLTNPAKDAGQVIGYSHSTWLSAEELLAGHPKDDSQVAGYGRAPARRHNDVISAARAVCSGSAASET